MAQGDLQHLACFSLSRCLHFHLIFTVIQSFVSLSLDPVSLTPAQDICTGFSLFLNTFPPELYLAVSPFGLNCLFRVASSALLAKRVLRSVPPSHSLPNYLMLFSSQQVPMSETIFLNICWWLSFLCVTAWGQVRCLKTLTSLIALSCI